MLHQLLVRKSPIFKAQMNVMNGCNVPSPNLIVSNSIDYNVIQSDLM